MRFFAVLALAAAASASLLPRQDVTFPDCSSTCLASADFGTCGTDDVCLCNSPAFINSVTDCIVKACQGDDLKNAETAAQQLCLAAGVTLTTTSSGAAPTSSASSTGSNTGSPANTSSSSSGSSTPSSSTTGSSTPSSNSTGSSTASSPNGTQSQSTGNNGAASHGANAVAALLAVGAAALVF